MKRHWFTVLPVMSVLAWPDPATAERGRGYEGKAKVERTERVEQHNAKPKKPSSPIAEQTVVIDRDGHRRVVTEYFSRESLPPGLAKRQSLPPGLQKQLRERGRLPPGLQKRLVPLPGPLVTQLPGVPPYYGRYFAGRDLIVIDKRTNTIVAVIPDVVVARGF